MARHGYYDEQYGFVPYDDCPQDNLYSESEAKHTFSPSEPKTNADRIRVMTDEELAELLRDYQCNTCDFIGCCGETDKCKEEIFEWLQSESGEA